MRRALEEDLGLAGDLTTDAVVPPGLRTQGHIVARTAGRLAGLTIAARAFELLDAEVRVSPQRPDGADLDAGETIAVVEGSARALLSAERVALNLLGHLSGVATATASLVSAVADNQVQVVPTRKTLPGLRALERYAVRAGGGGDHRFGLDDAVLVKDNHRLLCGSIAEAVRRVRAQVGHLVKVEVEVDSLDQLEEVLRLRVDAVLLDNQSPASLTEAVRRVNGAVITEASGGITLANAAAIAASGVDLISVGWITHSAPALDVALDLEAD